MSDRTLPASTSKLLIRFKFNTLFLGNCPFSIVLEIPASDVGLVVLRMLMELVVSVRSTFALFNDEVPSLLVLSKFVIEKLFSPSDFTVFLDVSLFNVQNCCYCT